MYTKQPKKLLIMNILDILRRYSDADHRLSQKDIVGILKKEYDMDADRKAIKRNLMNLIDFGYNLEFSESVRRNKNGEEETIYTDWYLVRDFSDAELRLLIDSILFSKHIPYNQCKRLIEKIEGLSNRYFKSRMRHVYNLPVDQPKNKEIFYTIEILDEAIEKKKQVVFNYGVYGTDKKLHLKKRRSGEPIEYTINPYQMVASNGRYYLIANVDRYDNVSHYRLDHIRNIRMTDISVKPAKKVRGFENGINLPKHMAEHIYMFSGESKRIVMKTHPDMANELIDWFGNGVKFSDETKDSVIASVTANAEAMRYWALQYAPYVTIISPQELVDTVKEDLEKALDLYDNAW